MQVAVSRSTQRIRSSARLDSPSASDTARAPWDPPTRDIEIMDVDVPNTRVAPNQRIPVTIKLRNGTATGALYSDESHPDFCRTSLLNRSGSNITMIARIGNSEDRHSQCFRGATLTASNTTTQQLQVDAPASGGTKTLTVQVVGRNTGEVLSQESTRITVEEETAPEPSPPPSGGGGSGGGNYDGGSDYDDGGDYGGGSDGQQQAGIPVSVVAGLGFAALIILVVMTLVS